MHNELFSVGSFTVYGYGLMIAAGFTAAVLIGMKRAPKFGLVPDHFFNIAVYGMILGLIGSKLLYFITEIDRVIKDPSILLNFSDGFVLYGGVIGGVLTAMFYCRRKKIDFLSYFDLSMPSVVIAQGFGRIGCLLAGCCYGAQTDAWYGIIFPSSSVSPSGIPLIPTQIISSAGDFIIGFILIAAANKNKTPGRIGALYMLLYGTGRFIIEFFRNDPRGTVSILSTSQFISVFIILAAVVMLLKLSKNQKGNEGSSDEDDADTALSE